MARPKKRRATLTPDQKRRYQDLVRQGWGAVTEGDLPKAERLFREAIRLAPHRGEGWHGLGVTRYQQDDPVGAYEALRQAVRVDPDLAEAWLNLAHAADTLGYTLEAYEAATRALDLARQQGFATAVLEGIESVVRALHRALERLAAELGLPLETEEDYRRLRRSYRYFQEGVEAANAGNYSAAAEAFRRSLEAGAESARTWSNLGVALLLQRRLDEAEEAFRKALALNPDYTPARANLQLLAKLRENPEEAVEALLHRYTDVKFNAPKRQRLK